MNSSLSNSALFQEISSVAEKVRKEMISLYGHDLAGHCIEASEKIVKMFSTYLDINAKTVEGWCRFDDEYYGSDRPWDPHTWAEIPSLNLYVDVTADQFNYGMDFENEFPAVIIQKGLPHGMQYDEPTWNDFDTEINKCDILLFAEDLMEYAASGLIDNVSDLSPLFTSSSGPIYRGLYLPKEWLSSGFVIEEWTGSTHWTKSESVAKRFSSSMDGEDFMLEYGEDKGLLNLSEILPLFEPVILVMNQTVRSLDLGNYLDLLEQEGYDVGSLFLSGKNDEQEVSVIGYDFRIDSVENKEGQCYVFVFPIERNREVEQKTQKQSLEDRIQSAASRAAHSYSIDKAPVKESTPER